MIKTFAIAACAALVAAAAPAQAGSNGNGPTLSGGDLQNRHNPVCSRVTGNCWVNNGPALNAGPAAAPYWQVSDSAPEIAPLSSPTVQRLDPLAVRLADGTLVSIR